MLAGRRAMLGALCNPRAASAPVWAGVLQGGAGRAAGKQKSAGAGRLPLGNTRTHSISQPLQATASAIPATTPHDLPHSSAQAPAEKAPPVLKPRSAVAITGCRQCDGRTEWLLILRANAPSQGEWALPGGSIELGEGTLAAAKRELIEETQLGADQATFCTSSFMTTDCITRDERGRMAFHYVIAQTFAVISPGAVVRASDDAAAAGWFTREEIQEGLFGKVTPGVLEVVERAEKLRKAGCLEVEVL
ncbi:NUDIX hydrolase domain-like protein [Baffinella frigidus]|nr:NUDIX hydrolase domain-like protein [Cryptophyta sp. CCMP2293]